MPRQNQNSRFLRPELDTPLSIWKLILIVSISVLVINTLIVNSDTIGFFIENKQLKIWIEALILVLALIPTFYFALYKPLYTKIAQINRDQKKLILFSDLLNQSNDAIFIIDPEDGHFIDVNNRACQNLGYSYEELLTMKVIDIEAIIPDDYQFRDHVRAIRANIGMLIEGVHKRKDGSTYDAQINVKSIIHDSQEYFLAIARDVSKQRNVERTLQMSEQQFRALVESSPDCIKLLDLEGHILYMNPGGLKEHNLKSVEAAQKWDLKSSVIPEDRHLVDDAINKAKHGHMTTFEMRHTHDGADRDVCLSSFVPVKNIDGEVTEIFGVSRDLTEIKASQNMKNEIIKNISHEIRTPITISKTALFNLQEQSQTHLDEKENKLIKISLENLSRMEKLSNNLIDIALLQSNKNVLHLESVDLTQLVDHVLIHFEKEIHEKNIKVTKEIQKTPLINADPKLIEKALTHLLDNALRFTQDQILIQLKINDDDVEIIIQDNGPGVAVENQSKLFHSFQQIDREDGPGYKGVGLGLIISKEIITLHSGNMGYDSSYTDGARFYFTLPL